MQKGLIVGIQDMGAAGLTCSSCEMGARAGTGVELDLDLVPQREAEMTPYEIMLSESQERMLLVAEKSKEKAVFDVFHKWGLDAVTVGRVTSDGLLRVRKQGKVVAEIPNVALADEAPVYQRPLLPPKSTLSSRLDDYSFLDGCEPAFIENFLAETNDWTKLLKLAVASPNLCSRRWIWQQYDHMVQSNTIVGPGSDAAVVRVKGTKKALALTLDGPAYRAARNPREGAKMAVAEACRNIVCAGGRPLAATNCLNFGNPEHPEIMWEFSEVVDGLAEACNFFGTPITGGNVSFYNETFGGDIYPTPVLGMVGLVEDLSLVTRSSFRKPGDSIALVEPINRLVGKVNLEDERAVQNLVAAAIRDQLIQSAHDVSEGGLAVAVAECCYSNLERGAIGAEIKVPSHLEIRKDVFGEFSSCVLLTTNNVQELRKRAEQMGLKFYDLGKVGGTRLILNYESLRIVDVAIDELESAWSEGLPKLFT
jgi:phosphoribosylformylglycinamidine synthase